MTKQLNLRLRQTKFDNADVYICSKIQQKKNSHMKKRNATDKNKHVQSRKKHCQHLFYLFVSELAGLYNLKHNEILY